MKKLICFIASIMLLLPLLGCDASNVNNENSVIFYYVHNEIEYGTDSGVIASTVANVNIKTDNYEELLALYFNGPTNYDCISPFAAGTTMVEFYIDNDKAQILLSAHMATLDNSKLTVALACITRTVIEMTGVSTVRIQIQNNKILGEDSITLSLNSFNYCDDITPDDEQ